MVTERMPSEREPTTPCHHHSLPRRAQQPIQQPIEPVHNPPRRATPIAPLTLHQPGLHHVQLPPAAVAVRIANYLHRLASRHPKVECSTTYYTRKTDFSISQDEDAATPDPPHAQHLATHHEPGQVVHSPALRRPLLD